MGLLKKILDFLTRPQTPRYVIVEIEKGVSGFEKGDEDAIIGLKTHPGFIALMRRLRLKRAVLEAQLKANRHKDIRDVDLLQLGIYWFGILEHEINASGVAIKNKTVSEPVDHEVKWFEEIRSSIESVRVTSPD